MKTDLIPRRTVLKGLGAVMAAIPVAAALVLVLAGSLPGRTQRRPA